MYVECSECGAAISGRTIDHCVVLALHHKLDCGPPEMRAKALRDARLMVAVSNAVDEELNDVTRT